MAAVSGLQSAAVLTYLLNTFSCFLFYEDMVWLDIEPETTRKDNITMTTVCRQRSILQSLSIFCKILNSRSTEPGGGPWPLILPSKQTLAQQWDVPIWVDDEQNNTERERKIWNVPRQFPDIVTLVHCSILATNLCRTPLIIHNPYNYETKDYFPLILEKN